MTHDLMLAPTLFDPVFLGLKRAVMLTDDDPNVETGDHLVLQEYLPVRGQFTGRWVRAVASFVEIDRAGRRLVSVQAVARGSGESVQRRIGVGRDVAAA